MSDLTTASTPIPRSAERRRPMDFLAELGRRTLILDGAMGTELMAAGYRSVECPEDWNVSQPRRRRRHPSRLPRGGGRHQSQTNTFGGSRSQAGRLPRRRARRRAQRGGGPAGARRCATRCAPDKLVAGDIGPSGTHAHAAWATPRSGRAARRLRRAGRGAASTGGVDLISIETMFDLDEARAAVLGRPRHGRPRCRSSSRWPSSRRRAAIAR